jgi:hypothetical protein
MPPLRNGRFPRLPALQFPSASRNPMTSRPRPSPPAEEVPADYREGVNSVAIPSDAPLSPCPVWTFVGRFLRSCLRCVDFAGAWRCSALLTLSRTDAVGEAWATIVDATIGSTFCDERYHLVARSAWARPSEGPSGYLAAKPGWAPYFPLESAECPQHQAGESLLFLSSVSVSWVMKLTCVVFGVAVVRSSSPTCDCASRTSCSTSGWAFPRCTIQKAELCIGAVGPGTSARNDC